MRARDADVEGVVEVDGVEIAYEVYGDGPVTILLMPTWTIIHKRFWKGQVPYLSRHFRVVVYDGPGNGGSVRAVDPAAYGVDRQVQYGLAVLDASATERAVVVGLSLGGSWAAQLAAEHGERVLGTILIAPSVPTAAGHPERAVEGDTSTMPPSRVRLLGRDPIAHWPMFDPDYWQAHFEDFLWFFFGMCFPEPRSSKQIEDCVGWGLETTPEVLAAEAIDSWPDTDRAVAWFGAIATPVLTIHGDSDMISPLRRSERIAELTGGELVVIEGGGHIPMARDPVKINQLIRDFARCVAPQPCAQRRSA